MAEPEASAAAPVGDSGTIVARTRQELVGALDGVARAALQGACACLYAGCSLKNDASEGGLTERQAALVRGWKARLISAALRQLADLARVSGALAALGAHPSPPRAAPPLRPYSQALIEELSGHDGGPAPEDAVDALLAGGAAVPPATAAMLALVDGDHPVTALDRIRVEFAAEVSDSRQARVAFEAVRPVVVDPALDGAGEPGSTPVGDERTAAVGRLFAEVWDTVLAMLTPGADGAGAHPPLVPPPVSP